MKKIITVLALAALAIPVLAMAAPAITNNSNEIVIGVEIKAAPLKKIDLNKEIVEEEAIAGLLHPSAE